MKLIFQTVRWTELEEAVDSMTSFITEACDEYFATIKDDVVQVRFTSKSAILST